MSAEIDEQVAAGNQIELGERRIVDEVMNGEQAEVSQFFLDVELIASLVEKSLDPLGRQFFRDSRRISALTCDREAMLVDVGCEYVNLRGRREAVHLLLQEHCNGVGLL